MREILFRGRRKKGDKRWVEGDLTQGYAGYVGIVKWCCAGTSFEVVPETVGQYTGLTDKNGARIFEGDIIHGNLGNFVVRWSDNISGFVAGEKERTHPCLNRGTMKCYKVIGNIYDNPELMEVEE